MPPNLRNRRGQTEDATPRVVEVDTDEEVEITRTAEQQRERIRLEHDIKKTYTVKVDDDDDENFRISLLDVLRVIVTFVVLFVGLSYYVTSGESYIWGFERQRPWWMRYNDIKQFMVRPFLNILFDHSHSLGA
jgi:hypothetical protein